MTEETTTVADPERRRKRVTAEDAAEFRRRYDAGETAEEIAAATGRKYGVVYRSLRGTGPMRPRGRRPTDGEGLPSSTAPALLPSPVVDTARLAAAGLRSRSVEAVKAVVAEIALGGRCRVTMAPGTGKTRVGAEASRHLAEAGRVLVVVPSLQLLAQVAREFAGHLGDGVGLLGAVCSDAAATAEATARLTDLDDELAVMDLGSSTDPAEVADWTRAECRLTVFCTFHSLTVVAAAHAAGALPWDLIVVDEAHHSAGRADADWALVNLDESIPAQRRLYMTATPRMLRPDRDGAFEVASMDDERVFGREVYVIPFARAIDEELLADYRVAVCTMTQDELRRSLPTTSPASTGGSDEPDSASGDTTAVVVRQGGPAIPRDLLVAQLALLKSARQYGVRTAITFHHRVAGASLFAETLHAAAELLPEPIHPRQLSAHAIHGGLDGDERRRILDTLQEPGDGFVVVSNAQLLAEGVDVPELDAVLFADPRDSVTNVVQAVSRALRRGQREHKTATIIIPILLPDTDSAEAAINSSSWESLYRILRALGDQDERLRTWLDDLRTKVRGYRRSSGSASARPELPPCIDLIGAPVDPDFAGALALRVLERTTSAWLVGYGAARAYHEKHGHLLVPKDYETDDGLRLGSWIAHQRWFGKQGTLSSDRVQLLNDIGMDWDPSETTWRRNYTCALAYFTRHGHLQVPLSYEDDSGLPLGAWVNTLRQRKDTLSEDQVSALEAIGMVWNVTQHERNRRLEAARAFYAEHGHLDVRSDYVTEDGVTLGSWLKHMRIRKRKQQLSDDEVKALEDAGMIWDRFAAGLDAARAFHAAHGHLNVPAGYTTPDGFDLPAWLKDQRVRRSTLGTASEEEIAALDELDMIWNIMEFEREQRWTAAHAFHAEHGHLRVSRDYVTPGGVKLGAWLESMRLKYRKGELSSGDIAKLDALGMVWRLRVRFEWSDGMAAARVFHAEHGHLNVPWRYRAPTGLDLGKWLRQQKEDEQRGALTSSRRAKLDALGIVWTDPDGPERSDPPPFPVERPQPSAVVAPAVPSLQFTSAPPVSGKLTDAELIP